MGRARATSPTRCAGRSGEQGRALRSRRAEDVVFAGSERRAALGMADVALVLDNADGLLPVDYAVARGRATALPLGRERLPAQPPAGPPQGPRGAARRRPPCRQRVPLHRPGDGRPGPRPAARGAPPALRGGRRRTPSRTPASAGRGAARGGGRQPRPGRGHPRSSCARRSAGWPRRPSSRRREPARATSLPSPSWRVFGSRWHEVATDAAAAALVLAGAQRGSAAALEALQAAEIGRRRGVLGALGAGLARGGAPRGARGGARGARLPGSRARGHRRRSRGDRPGRRAPHGGAEGGRDRARWLAAGAGPAASPRPTRLSMASWRRSTVTSPRPAPRRAPCARRRRAGRRPKRRCSGPQLPEATSWIRRAGVLVAPSRPPPRQPPRRRRRGSGRPPQPRPRGGAPGARRDPRRRGSRPGGARGRPGGSCPRGGGAERRGGGGGNGQVRVGDPQGASRDVASARSGGRGSGDRAGRAPGRWARRGCGRGDRPDPAPSRSSGAGRAGPELRRDARSAARGWPASAAPSCVGDMDGAGARPPAATEMEAARGRAARYGGGLLADAIRADPGGAVRRLLARWAWAPSVADAIDLAATLPPGWRVAVREGGIVGAEGIVALGVVDAPLERRVELDGGRGAADGARGRGGPPRARNGGGRRRGCSRP